MLQGHLNYYAVSGNGPSLWWYFNEVRWRWIKSLKRRSQRAFMRAGKSSPASPTASSRPSGYYTRCPVTVSTPEPEGRARCVSSACREPCGGRLATAVPTVTIGEIEMAQCSSPPPVKGRATVRHETARIHH